MTVESLLAVAPWWKMCSFSKVALLLFSPPTFFVCICAHPDSHSLSSSHKCFFFFPNSYTSLSVLAPLLHLEKVVSASSTHGVKQQCPLKDERIWREMLRPETWRTTQTSPRIRVNTWSILAFRTDDLRVATTNIWVIWSLSNCLWTSGTASLVLHMWPMMKRLVHTPITGDMLLPHFAELKLCRDT